MPGRKAPGRRSHGKGASKGQRWAKGHSCVSNPTTTKHRDAASSQFLHPVIDNPLFTVKNVAAVQAQTEDSDMDEDLTSEVESLTISDISCGTGLSSVSTLKSLSSAWSKVSTNAFDRFLKRFRSDSLVHKEMLSILAASSDVINNAGGKLKDTEFFATFLTFLDSCTPDQYQPVMSLLCIIISRVSPSVLKLRFEDIYPKISTILSFSLENNNDLLIRTSIEAIAKLIRVQGRLNLEDDKKLQEVICMILKCTLHEKPRVRKKARNVIKKFVSQSETLSSNSMVKLTIGWILDQLSVFPTCETKVVADVLSLLLCVWASVTTISKPGAKKLFEGVLRVMSSGDIPIMKIGFTFFIEAFQNFSAITECDPQDELFSKLIVAVWELQPDTRNTECYILWLRCILSGLVRLGQGPSNFDMTYLCASMESASPLLLTNAGQNVSKTFKEFLPHIITEEIDMQVLERVFRVLSKSLLTVPPNVYALQILESLLENLTPSLHCVAAQDVFLQLIPLRNAQGVLSAMGKFIWAFGVEKIWSLVDPPTRWCVVLPLLNENLHNSDIQFWKLQILPGLGAKIKAENGWDALIGFCRNPKDPENFPAELIGKTIVEKPNLRLQSLAALRQFVDWRQCEQMTKKYSKNFLPLLFNLYITTKPDSENLRGHSDAVGSTIQKYLEHCEETFITELATRALTKLANEVEEAASPVFDLVAFLAVHVPDKEMQEKILDITLKKWAKLGDGKRSYRIMTSLSKNKNLNGDVLQKLIDTLKQTPAETKSNAAALRIECMSVITAMNDQWLKIFLPEIIMNMLSANSKAKKLSCSYVEKYAKYVKESNHTVDDAIEIIEIGLASQIPLMVSCTLRFAYYVYKEIAPDTPNQSILQRSIEILSNSSDGIVCKFAFQFLTLNLQLYKGALGPIANQFGKIVADQKYQKKDSARLLARMIKVFGAVGVKAILPNSEDPKMRNRIKNICKKLREKKVREEKINDDNTDDEGDSEDDDMDIDVRMSNKTPLVMKEGVVDFLSPSDIAKSFINERPKKETEAFKLSEDGKLIIDIEDPKSKRKRKACDDDSDLEDEGNGDPDELDFLKKKRNSSSAASNKSSKSKYSMKSFKSSSVSSRKSAKQMKSNSSNRENTKGALSEVHRKKIKAKRFKSSSSVKSSKSMKSRKSAAASTFRLKY